MRTHLVLGCPRSGTSFLMRVLDAVPETACVSGVVYPIGALHLAGHGLDGPARRVLADEFTFAFRNYLESGLHRSRARRLQKWKNTGARLRDLPSVWQTYAEPDALVYKEPFLSLAPEFVYDALPEARIVYLLRDGRDCAASLVSSYDVLTDAKLRNGLGTEARLGRPYDDRIVPWWVEDGAEDAFMEAPPFVRAAWMWRYMALRCHAFFGRPDVRAGGRVLEVRYERLMRSPLDEGERVARHLGLTLSPKARRRLAGAHARSIASHRRWDPTEVAAAEAVIGDALGTLDYPLTTAAPALAP